MTRTNIKRKTALSSSVFLFTLILSLAAFGQEEADRFTYLVIPDKNSMQILTLTDGSTILGRITEIRAKEVVFKTDVGDMTVPRTKISKLELVPARLIKKAKYWFENPNTTRLYFGPTARMLKKGDGYFSDYYLFFPSIAYGITDNFTFGAGMSIFPGLNINEQVFYFTPKIGLKASPNTNFAAGALIIALPEDDNKSTLVGILYGVATFGSPDADLTVGLGYGFVEDQLAEKPMIMIGGEKRISRRVSFVSENWMFPGVDEPVVSYGFRFFGDGLSVDLALVNALGKDIFFPGLPWVDFVVNF